MEFKQENSMNMFPHYSGRTAAFEKHTENGQQPTSLLSAFSAAPLGPLLSKVSSPLHYQQQDGSISPRCVTAVSSQHIPIQKGRGRDATNSSVDEQQEYMGDFYDQATWRMYERIQAARHKMMTDGHEGPVLPQIDYRDPSSRTSIKGFSGRLQQRRRASLNQQSEQLLDYDDCKQQEDDDTSNDHLEDAIFDMDF